VGLGGLEPPTSRLSSARSNQLSYKPELSSALKARPFDDLWREERRRRRRPANAAFDKAADSKSSDKASKRKPKLPRPRLAPEDVRPLIRDFLRKEVIQPQVPLRLPCYDFTPVADPTVVACLLTVSKTPSGKANSHGVTGGVYKARERIHRGVLIRDY